jgi:hypothetical protein
VSVERGEERVGIADRHHHGVGRDARGHAGRPGRSHHVVGAVVGAVEAQDRITARERAGRADSDHDRLRAGVGEAPALAGGHAGTELGGERDLVAGRQPEAAALLYRPDRGHRHARVGVAVDQRGVVVLEVDELAAVLVEHVATLAP